MDNQPAAANGARTTLASRLQTLVDGVRGSAVEEALEARLAAIEDTLDGLAERLEALARTSASDAGERLASLDDRLTALSQSLQAERAAAAQHRDRTALTLQDQAVAFDEWAEAVRGALEEVGDSTGATLSSLGASLSDAAAASREADRRHLDAMINDLSATVDEEVAALRSDLADALEEVSNQVTATLRELHEDWRPRTDAVIAEGRAAAQGALVDFEAKVDTALADITGALAGQLATVRQVTATLDTGTDRFIAAGKSLLAYLAERDRWLERERDRVLHELLDEFGQGLTAREAKAVSSRVTAALDRRRDARDADRWRRAQPDLVEPPMPDDLAALGEPIPALDAPPALQPALQAVRSGPARRSASSRQPAAAKRTAKTASKSAAKSTAKKVTKSTSKTAAKTTAKRASSRSSGRSTGTTG